MSTITKYQPISFKWTPDVIIPALVPPIKSWRPYRREDRTAVANLQRPCTEVLFGHFDIDEMLLVNK